MPFRGETRKVDRTAEELARIQALRERFQSERPTHEELIASGDYEGPIPQASLVSYFSTVAKLKRERERQGLTLADISERSGLDVGLLSRLENGKVVNPMLTTLWRYADALGCTVTLDVSEAAAV
jgi:Helix-turn-helix